MTLIGRDTELAQLRDIYRQTRDGRGRLVVISGEPGIGKSAVVEAIASELANQFDVTWGRALELADAPAYFPLWPCLKSLGITVAATQAELGAFELWEHVLEALVRATERRPVLWIVEDVHVADTQTLDLLCFLSQGIRGLPVLLLTTTRPSEQKRVLRLARDGKEIRLAPLDAPAVAALAARWLGRDLKGDVAARFAERTRGNPLFVVECARGGKQLLETVPPTIAVVVDERMQQLAPTARDLLCDAAIVGNEVTAAMLAAMRDVLPARVIDDIAPALKAGMLDELGPGRYRFSHALVRDAIEAGLGAPARLDAHVRAARALAALPDSPKVRVERARHALASISLGAASGPQAQALDAAQHALNVLEQQGTHDRAAVLCKQMFELRAQGRLPPATAAELVRAARVALAAGQFTDSRVFAIAAADAARDARDVDAFAQAALALGADVHAGRIDREILRHLEEALAWLGSGPSPLRCRVTARLAAAMQPAFDPQVPVAMARQAIDEARASGDAALLSDVLFVGISALTSNVDTEELCSLNLEHLALTRAADDTAQMLRAYTRLLLCELELGHLAAFDEHLYEMLQIASSLGHPRLTWRAHLLGSMRAIARGQFAESERYLAEVERAAQLTDDPSLAMSWQAHRHLRAIDLHRETTVANAWPELEAGLAPLPGGAVISAQLRALAAARFGDTAAVSRALAGYPLDQSLAHRASVSNLGVLGEVYAAAGTAEERNRLLAALGPYADRHVHASYVPMIYCGPVRRVIGLLELALGNRAAGEAHLRRALETCRALGFATWVARISFELGQLDEAAQLATNLGIRGLARRANASPTAMVSPPTRPALGISRDGAVWRISYGVRVTRIAESRGMALIAKLVERPGEEMHVLVLAGIGGDSLANSDAGEALDDRAARTYRDRLAEIEAVLPDARPRQAQELEREREFLTKELARAFGLAGAPRKVASISERARVNVQRRIKDALGRISQQDPVIADYLRAAIRTGTYCTFRP